MPEAPQLDWVDTGLDTVAGMVMVDWPEWVKHARKAVYVRHDSAELQSSVIISITLPYTN